MIVGPARLSGPTIGQASDGWTLRMRPVHQLDVGQRLQTADRPQHLLSPIHPLRRDIAIPTAEIESDTGKKDLQQLIGQCDIIRQHGASFSSPRVMPPNSHSPYRL